MNDKFLADAVADSLVAGLGIVAMMIAGEKKSGKSYELIDLQRLSAWKLDVRTPNATALQTGTEQTIAQGGHLLRHCHVNWRNAGTV